MASAGKSTPAVEVWNGALTVSTYSDASSELKSLRQAVGMYDLGDKVWIRATGSDRVRWLNGMVTNSIQQLQPGHGCYSFVLSAQGRIQGDLYAFAQQDSLLLETGVDQISPLMVLLDRFIIMDDVELHNESAQWAGIGVAGPQAAAMLAHIGLHFDASLQDLKPVQLLHGTLATGEPLRLVAAHRSGVPRFELWCPPAAVLQLWNLLEAAGSAPCGAQSVAWLRILEGTPRYGTDIRDKDLPQETAQVQALHFAKGCYIGQEIVERIRSRGNVHRTFTGFRLHGAAPGTGAPIEAAGQKVGEITSFAQIPIDGQPHTLALGYVRRDALERKSTLQYEGGTAEAVTLPFTGIPGS